MTSRILFNIIFNWLQSFIWNKNFVYSSIRPYLYEISKKYQTDVHTNAFEAVKWRLFIGPQCFKYSVLWCIDNIFLPAHPHQILQICVQTSGWQLTHWGPSKMAAILQTPFSNTFFWMKRWVFWESFTISMGSARKTWLHCQRTGITSFLH